MKISKHLHSCLLIEEADKTFLIDPGIFTYEEKALDITTMMKLDYLLITHEHPDHMHLPFVKDIVATFPKTKIITTPAIVDILRNENITATNEGDTLVHIESLAHEALWDVPVPQNVLMTVCGKLTTPGDSHHVTSTEEILALPIQAPWGSTIDAVNLAVKLKPKVIIPVHDWMWKDAFRKIMYQRLTPYFEKLGIQFKGLELGEAIEI